MSAGRMPPRIEGRWFWVRMQGSTSWHPAKACASAAGGWTNDDDTWEDYTGSVAEWRGPIEEPPPGNPQMLALVPAKFWHDHVDRFGEGGQTCSRDPRSKTAGRVVRIYGTLAQLDFLRKDAKFYADGNVDDCDALVRSARATVTALQPIRLRKEY